MKVLRKLCLIFIVLIITSTLGGWTATIDIELKHNGKSQLELKVESTLEESEFRAAVQKKIDLFNLISGDDDMYIVREIKKYDGGYIVVVKTRLLEGIKGASNCQLKTFSEFVREGSIQRKLLEDWENGNLRDSVPLAVDGVSGMLEIERGPKKNNLYVKPKTITGEEITAAELIAVGEKADKREELLTFMFLNIENVSSLTLAVPGKIEYYAGEGITLIDENTLQIIPGTIKANVHYNTSNGELVYEEDRDIPAAIGYVVYRETLSPLEITAIVVICVVIVAFVTGVLVYFYRLGKKAQLKDEETGEINE